MSNTPGRPSPLPANVPPARKAAPKSLVCIVCPRGCRLDVDEKLQVTGNACPRGAAYAAAEMTHPTRMVTSTVRLAESRLARVPVKTSCPVPKEKIADVMAEIRRMTVRAPVQCGDVVIGHVAGLDADVVATRTVVE